MFHLLCLDDFVLLPSSAFQLAAIESARPAIGLVKSGLGLLDRHLTPSEELPEAKSLHALGYFSRPWDVHVSYQDVANDV